MTCPACGGPLAPWRTVPGSEPGDPRFPRFENARDRALVVELEPGDALYVPKLWWHQVEALEAFNVLVNYWWNPSPGFIDTPQTTLLHGLLSLRDRPEHEKQAWKALFDFYVFGPADGPAAHLEVYLAQFGVRAAAQERRPEYLHVCSDRN